jgi:hypothetical protein
MATKITRSPRAPSIDLEEAVRKSMKLLDKEGKHAVPSDLAVKHMGYSGINNGAAARALASLKSFGLVDSTSKGDVSASRDVESYAYAPDESMKRDLLLRWLRSPKVYADLLDEYADRLPSDQAIRYKLIKMGFTPPAADECSKNFKASVGFARFYDKLIPPAPHSESSADYDEDASNAPPEGFLARPQNITPAGGGQAHPFATHQSLDRIPVRLTGGRRAAIEIPSPFFNADKEMMKRQIDLLLTDDDEVV